MPMTETAAQYAKRIVDRSISLGVNLTDIERILICAYDNPPRKPLPKTCGERNRQIWISDMLKDCLVTMADGIDGTMGTVDSIANAALTLFVKDNAPEIWALHERFQAERADIKKRLKALRQNEPELQPQEEA